MGVLNVTPDSFSDAGESFDPACAIERALQIEAEGADLVDIGAESTRPGAHPIEPAEEWRRLRPVLKGLAGRLRIPTGWCDCGRWRWPDRELPTALRPRREPVG